MLGIYKRPLKNIWYGTPLEVRVLNVIDRVITITADINHGRGTQNVQKNLKPILIETLFCLVSTNMAPLYNYIKVFEYSFPSIYQPYLS